MVGGLRFRGAGALEAVSPMSLQPAKNANPPIARMMPLFMRSPWSMETPAYHFLVTTLRSQCAQVDAIITVHRPCTSNIGDGHSGICRSISLLRLKGRDVRNIFAECRLAYLPS